jgi:hypothetical protein
MKVSMVNCEHLPTASLVRTEEAENVQLLNGTAHANTRDDTVYQLFEDNVVLESLQQNGSADNFYHQQYTLFSTPSRYWLSFLSNDGNESHFLKLSKVAVVAAVILVVAAALFVGFYTGSIPAAILAAGMTALLLSLAWVIISSCSRQVGVD